jgi:mannose-6-phosphate isomerase
VRPVALPPNPVDRFYRGGPRIARFRGVEGWGDMTPEDWVGSTTAVAGEPERGRASLADGTLVADALAADPEGWLGPEHAERFGADPGLLVKLLDAGERLPVHWHPDRRFARERLHSCYGKTEGWIIVEADPGAVVHLGWRRDVTPTEVAHWHETQDVESMLEALHSFEVRPGETVLVPAGYPHAIGEGILLVELQEPTDFSVLLEWKGFTGDPTGVGDFGLGYAVALGSVRPEAVPEHELSRLREGRDPSSGLELVEPLFPTDADRFFRAERAGGGATLGASFAVFVVVEGAGRLVAGDESIELARGDTLLVPHGAGPTRLEGSVTAIRCMTPVEPPEGKVP